MIHIHLLDGKGRYIKNNRKQRFVYSMQECLKYLVQQAREEKFHLLEHMLSVTLHTLNYPQNACPYGADEKPGDAPRAISKKNVKRRKKIPFKR